MPRRYSTREVEVTPVRAGFRVVRQRGSHIRLQGTLNGAVRNGTLIGGEREIAVRTLDWIRLQLGLVREDFERLVDDAHNR